MLPIIRTTADIFPVMCQLSDRLHNDALYAGGLPKLREMMAPAQAVNVKAAERAAAIKLAALRIKDQGAGVYSVPSATDRAAVYTVIILAGGRVSCSCPNAGRNCWHGAECLKLEAAKTPAQVVTEPAPVPAPERAAVAPAPKIDPKRAYAELFGSEAA